jgi:SpoVK/Ycf46/Vps4 family AAA+-type ATPase
MTGYTDSLEHVLDELRRIDLLIRHQVQVFRLKGREAMDEFRGLYVTESEIDTLLQQDNLVTTTVEIEPADEPLLLHRLNELQAHIATQKAVSLQSGTALRLERLKELFHLSPFDVDALLLCLAPELDLQYEKLFAFLQDDVTRKRPSVGLVLDLFCHSVKAKQAARTRFTSSAPLLIAQLLRLSEEALERPRPLLTTALQVDERIVQYLLGVDHCDARVFPVICSEQPQRSWQEVILPEDLRNRLEQLIQYFKQLEAQTVQSSTTPQGIVVCFHGPAGVGKQTIAATLCREFTVPLLVVDVAGLLRVACSPDTAVRVLFREAVLQQSALSFDHFELLLAKDERVRPYRDAFLAQLAQFSGLTFLNSEKSWQPARILHHKSVIRVDIPVPSYADRIQLWHGFLNSHAPGDLDLGVLSSKFRLNAGQMCDAVAMAHSLAFWRHPANGQVTESDIEHACSAQSRHQLSTFAHQLQPRYSWTDIVLPKEQLTQLREVINAVKYRHQVYGDWGFDTKLSLGKGLIALFAGPSGTGKTMAAEVIAGELQLELYKIDLSTVVSKYIGETEKNLERIFREARDANAILFFDEADALFGKRSEVKDAHDRYANLEIAYLLQEMERHEGIVILATNLRNNMDEAFVRRMHTTIEFPFPEEAYRRRIWEGIFPSQAPIGDDADFAFLAHHFKLSGGNIKNVALHAAFLAAESGSAIGMAHLIQATKREYHKLGRLCGRADFGPYYDLVREIDG